MTSPEGVTSNVTSRQRKNSTTMANVLNLLTIIRLMSTGTYRRVVIVGGRATRWVCEKNYSNPFFCQNQYITITLDKNSRKSGLLL
jgi:hypothetical protein